MNVSRTLRAAATCTLALAACMPKAKLAEPPLLGSAATADAAATMPVAADPGAPTGSYGAMDPAAPGVAAATPAAFAPLYFAFNSDDLAPEARVELQELAALLERQPQAAVTISGHCDERGTAEYNLALGERRAHAARAYLSRLGVAPARVQVVSYGSERPAETGAGESVWARNRRDELQVAGLVLDDAVPPAGY